MKILFTIVSFAIALSCANAQTSKPQLQIGIKKRVENCQVKTQKGDLVHIHYTVSTFDAFSSIFDELSDITFSLTFDTSTGNIRRWESVRQFHPS